MVYPFGSAQDKPQIHQSFDSRKQTIRWQFSPTKIKLRVFCRTQKSLLAGLVLQSGFWCVFLWNSARPFLAHQFGKADEGSLQQTMICLDAFASVLGATVSCQVC